MATYRGDTFELLSKAADNCIFYKFYTKIYSFNFNDIHGV
jgi:hypothetical protein